MYKMQCRIFSSVYIKKKKHGRVSNSICMCEKRQGSEVNAQCFF